jgi:hypothetical protein
MGTRPQTSSFVLAALYGALFSFILGTVWGYYAANHPFNQWLIDSLLKNGYVVAYYGAIYTHDLLLNTIIALPFAYLIGRLQPRYSWLLLATGLMVAVSVVYWPALIRPRSALLVLPDWAGFVPLVVLVLSLPIGFSLLKLSKRGTADAG